FALGDWIYFGLTDDLRNIFSISLIDKNKLHGEIINGYHLTYQNLSPEQYVWINFLRKKEDIRLSHFTYFPEDLNNKLEESYAKNTIMISASRFGVESLKYPRVGYAAKPWLSKGFYTMSEYNKIYNKYNKDKIFYIKNYFEELLYYIQIKSRYISRGSNKTRKIIVNILRMFNGMKSLD
ncbi:MAG: hypothetical protein QG630_444, partial [Patescibacteria group bacterium]|nr:hypothetical protein [Patescibacteria group bacterium]